SDRTLVDFISGRATRDAATHALMRASNQSDTTRVYAALVNPKGEKVLSYAESSYVAPQWLFEAIASHHARTDSMTLGPLTSSGGHPVAATIRPLHGADATPPAAYLVEVRRVRGRGVREIQSIIGIG